MGIHMLIVHMSEILLGPDPQYFCSKRKKKQKRKKEKKKSNTQTQTKTKQINEQRSLSFDCCKKCQNFFYKQDILKNIISEIHFLLNNLGKES